MAIRAWQLLSAVLAGAVVTLAAVLLVMNGVPGVQAHNGTAGAGASLRGKRSALL